MPVSPTQGRAANLSTVAMRKQGQAAVELLVDGDEGQALVAAGEAAVAVRYDSGRGRGLDRRSGVRRKVPGT
jgi:hypothetical protein